MIFFLGAALVLSPPQCVEQAAGRDDCELVEIVGFSGGRGSCGNLTDAMLDVSPLVCDCYEALAAYTALIDIEHNPDCTLGNGTIPQEDVEFFGINIELDPSGLVGADTEPTRLRFTAFGTLSAGDQATIPTSLIPPQLACSLTPHLSPGEQGRVVARVAVAYMLGGVELESPPMDIPVDVCHGCVLVDTGIACDSGLVDPDWPDGPDDCFGPDEPTWCCTDESQECPVCPAEDTSTSSG